MLTWAKISTPRDIRLRHRFYRTPMQDTKTPPRNYKIWHYLCHQWFILCVLQSTYVIAVHLLYTTIWCDKTILHLYTKPPTWYPFLWWNPTTTKCKIGFCSCMFATICRYQSALSQTLFRCILLRFFYTAVDTHVYWNTHKKRLFAVHQIILTVNIVCEC